MSLYELFGESKPATRSERGPAPHWHQQIEVVARMFKTVLAEANTQ